MVLAKQEGVKSPYRNVCEAIVWLCQERAGNRKDAVFCAVRECRERDDRPLIQLANRSKLFPRHFWYTVRRTSPSR
jgi:hypothetical protein